MQSITPFLWFDNNAEEAASFYVSVFSAVGKDSKIKSIVRYNDAGANASGQPQGSAMTVEFELNGQPFTALNGGPVFKFTEAVSFVVHCKTQEEVDHFWNRLSEGGDEKAQQCGWLKDKYGLSWQIVPTALNELLGGTTGGKVMQALLQMKKLDIQILQKAAKG